MLGNPQSMVCFLLLLNHSFLIRKHLPLPVQCQSLPHVLGLTELLTWFLDSASSLDSKAYLRNLVSRSQFTSDTTTIEK